MNDTLKVASRIGAELGAAKAEVERLRGLLREAAITLDGWRNTDELDDLAEKITAALTQQAEPTDTYTAVEMATAAAQGFRDGQAAVEQDTAQDEREAYSVWRDSNVQEGRTDTNGYHAFKAGAAWQRTRPAQTEQQLVAVPEDFQPLETIRWWISAYTNPENGPSYQGHGMMVRMLCEYEALRIMLNAQARGEQPAAYPHDVMDAIALSRYRVGASGAGTLHGFAVRAGDGEQELYRGSKSDCEHVARKLAGAFLDGGFTAFERYAAPIAQTAPQPEQSGLAGRLSSVITELKGGFVVCQQCGDQEDTATLDCVPELEAIAAALSAVTAERDRLANAFGDCVNSLHAEMLQKYGGQLPEDMHPVTRRDYDRDMEEIAEYRAAMAAKEA